MPMVPMPAAARYRSRGEPSPPAPTQSTLACLSLTWPLTPTCGRMRWREYLEISACVSPSVSRSAGEVGSASADADADADADAARPSSCLSGAATASRVRRRMEVAAMGMIVGVVKPMLGARDAAMSATVAAAAAALVPTTMRCSC